MARSAYPKFRRRNFFIKKRLQGSFVAGFSAVVLLGILLNLALAYYLIDRELAAKLYEIHIKIRTTAELVWPVLWRLSAVTLSAGFVAAAVMGYTLTRRVEIPLLAVIESARRLAHGDFSGRLSRVRLDSLPEVFNMMTASLEKSFRAVKGSSDSIGKGFERVERLVAGRHHKGRGEDELQRLSELRRALNVISEEEARIRHEISRFRI